MYKFDLNRLFNFTHKMTKVLTEIQSINTFTSTVACKSASQAELCHCNTETNRQIHDIVSSKLFIKDTSSLIRFVPNLYASLSSKVTKNKEYRISNLENINKSESSNFMDVINKKIGMESVFCHWFDKMMALNTFYNGEIQSSSFDFEKVKDQILFSLNPQHESQNKCSCTSLKFRTGKFVSQNDKIFIEPPSMEIAVNMLLKIAKSTSYDQITEDSRKNLDSSSMAVLMHWKDLFLTGRIQDSGENNKIKKLTDNHNGKLANERHEHDIPNEQSFGRIQTNFGLVLDVDEADFNLSEEEKILQDAYTETINELIKVGKLKKYNGDLETTSSEILRAWTGKSNC